MFLLGLTNRGFAGLVVGEAGSLNDYFVPLLSLKSSSLNAFNDFLK